ncbi:ER membrane protein complex subunit 5-like [Mya arenaria]|uniref:ER membrane protein complex subunit 5-like n=1 Tax=Mya arenaria TaxID=6604 RepID=UPI0022E4E240|nr:ER membrane protein complex subunit 5-like [Mya arenaria]
MMNFYQLCVLLGLLALLHAAYSAAQHRTYLRLTEQEFTSLPWDILIQCLASLLVVIYGIVHIAGNFREIRASADLDHKTWEMLGNRQGFLSFNHRGKALNRKSSIG